MATLEERVAYLEGKTEEHCRGFGELRELVIHLDHKVDRFREELASRIDSTNARIESTNARIDALDTKLNARIDRVDARIDTLDAKFSRYFLWTIGIQATILLAVIGALLGK